MARVVIPDTVPPEVLHRFLGLRLDSTGDTQIAFGESGNTRNFFITENGKLRRRKGYYSMGASLGVPINGQFYGQVIGEPTHLFSAGTKIYFNPTLSGTEFASLDTTTYTNVDVVITTALDSITAGTTGVDNVIWLVNYNNILMSEVAQANIDLVASVHKFYYHTDKKIYIIVKKGSFATIADYRDYVELVSGRGGLSVAYQIGTTTNNPHGFFAFDGSIYIMDTQNYYKWTGSGAVAAVVGYEPHVFNACSPDFSSYTALEPINMLTGKKYQTCSPDGVAATFQLAQTGVDSIGAVILNGTTLTLTTNYTQSIVNGTVTLNSVPAEGTDTLEIHWVKDDGNRSKVYSNKYGMIFGGENDIRVHLWGAISNKYYYSELANGIPSAEYFPQDYVNTAGTDEYAITSIIKHYDRQIVFKQSGAWYAGYDSVIDSDFNKRISFPLYPLNDSIGDVAPNQARIIKNNPFTIQNGVRNWMSTNVRDERNEEIWSLRVQKDLDALDLSTAITADWELKREYWLCVGNWVWIYNYGIDVWYRYKLSHTATSLCVVNDTMVFGTATGEMYVFDEDVPHDAGTAIDDYWEMNFYSFNTPWIRKYITKFFVSLQPESNSYIRIRWITNNKGLSESKIKEITYRLFDYGNIDYGDWTYGGVINPQPFKIKGKAKKFTYYKLVLDNCSLLKTATVLDITFPVRYGGDTK